MRRGPRTPEPARRWLDLLARDRFRLILAVVLSIPVNVAIGLGWAIDSTDAQLTSLNLSWLNFSACYLAMTAIVFARSTAESTRSWAHSERGGRQSWLIRWFVGDAHGFWFVATVAVFGVVAALLLVRSETAGSLEVVVGTIGVVLSWVMMQTTFSLLYALAYHNAEGIVLIDEPNPDLLDFAYIAFTVGTSFTIVDVTITSKRMRRVVLGHSVLSFTFNTVLLGLVVTFLAG